jgi:hypothetical protein
MEEQHEDHGHSVAAWTAVGIILLGSAITSVGIVVSNVPVSVVGGVVIVLGAVAGKVLSMAGYGASSHHAQAGTFVDAPDEVGSKTRGQS